MWFLMNMLAEWCYFLEEQSSVLFLKKPFFFFLIIEIGCQRCYMVLFQLIYSLETFLIGQIVTVITGMEFMGSVTDTQREPCIITVHI